MTPAQIFDAACTAERDATLRHPFAVCTSRVLALLAPSPMRAAIVSALQHAASAAVEADRAAMIPGTAPRGRKQTTP